MGGGKKKRLFGSNIFGGRRENNNKAEGPGRAKLSVPAGRSGGEGEGEGRSQVLPRLPNCCAGKAKVGAKKREGVINGFAGLSKRIATKIMVH